jgi:hypothetical protein
MICPKLQRGRRNGVPPCFQSVYALADLNKPDWAEKSIQRSKGMPVTFGPVGVEIENAEYGRLSSKNGVAISVELERI